MALSVKELLEAIDKLKGDDLKKVKDKLGTKKDESERKKGESDEEYEKRLERIVKNERELVDLKYAQAKALGEYNTAIQIGFELEEKYNAELNAMKEVSFKDTEALREEREKANAERQKEIDAELESIDLMKEAQDKRKEFLKEKIKGIKEE